MSGDSYDSFIHLVKRCQRSFCLMVYIFLVKWEERTFPEGYMGKRGTEIQDMESRTPAYKLKKKNPGKCSQVSVQLGVSDQDFLMIATCLV